MDNNIQIATFGGGCFWCIDAAFRRVKGVLNVSSGYAGGEIENPSYQQICTGLTGHAEVVQLDFDSSIVSYNTLLEMFFTLHDATQLNRQGNDVGTQYRSVIYYHTEQQKAEAQTMIAKFVSQLSLNLAQYRTFTQQSNITKTITMKTRIKVIAVSLSRLNLRNSVNTSLIN